MQLYDAAESCELSMGAAIWDKISATQTSHDLKLIHQRASLLLSSIPKSEEVLACMEPETETLEEMKHR